MFWSKWGYDTWRSHREREPPSSSIKRVSIAFSSAWIPLFYDDCHLHNSIDCNYINNDGSGKHPKVENWVLEKSCWIGLIQTVQSFSLFFCHVLTQCARIRVPVVSIKIQKFKDLFRAALDRWLDSHESKNFGFGRTRRPIRPIFSAILPILGKI